MRSNVLQLVAVSLISVSLIALGCSGDDSADVPGEPTIELPPIPEEVAKQTRDAAKGQSAIKRVNIVIYQRAATASLELKPTWVSIIDFASPIERSRQLVERVLSGVKADGALRPVPQGVEFHDVFIDDRGTAWVDLKGGSISRVRGADEEESLVACLSRTLVDALPEIERVGVIIDGSPKRTLAGHVDLGRTYTGKEWQISQ